MPWFEALERTEPRDASVVVVHDYLTQRGGAERVAATIAGGFSGAPLYTSVFEPSQTFQAFGDLDVRTTWLNHIAAFRHDPRRAFPLLAPTFSSLTIDAEVVIASSSGWAHGVRTDAPVIVYCHAPARWLYQRDRYVGDPARGSKGFSMAATSAVILLGRPLRSWDARAAHRAVRYVVNSTAVAAMVTAAYGITPEILPPPPALGPDGHREAIPGIEPEFILCVSRLLPYKNVDVVLEVARRRASDRFVIVGDGPLRSALISEAPKNVTFLAKVTDNQLRWLYMNSALLLAPSHEDFGLTPLEAASCGTPTAALRAGGYLDTIVDGATGVFFDSLDIDDIDAAVEQLVAQPPARHTLRDHATTFSSARFLERLRAIVADVSSAR